MVKANGVLRSELLENQTMSTAKLAIMILVIAALLFMVAPRLSWGSCASMSNGPAKLPDPAAIQDWAPAATSLR